MGRAKLPSGEGPALPPRYRDVERLGEGGMGVVYRAYDATLERPVAIKLVQMELEASPTLLPRFLREIRLLGALAHPHVVRIFDAGESGGVPWFAMEMVEGPTLAAALKEGDLPLPRLVELLAQVADALAAVNGAGILHRDLKPQNVMLAPDGAAKLMDFGLAKELGGQSTALTGSGQLVGTLGFIAPEALRGEPADERSDVFALGAVAYFALAGRLPIGPEDMVRAVLRGTPPVVAPPSSGGGMGDAELDAAVLAACAFERAARTPTAGEVHRALLAWLESRRVPQVTARAEAHPDRPAPPRPPPRAQPSTPRAAGAPRPPAPRRSPWPALGALALALLVLGLCAWRSGSGPRPQPEPNPSPAEVAAFLTLRARLLEPAARPEERDLVSLAELAQRQGILTRLAIEPAASKASAGLYYLACFARDRGHLARAGELFAQLVARPDPDPPRPWEELFEQAQAAARAAGDPGPLEAALDAVAAREADPEAALRARRLAFDHRLKVWRERNQPLNGDWEAGRRADPSALRAQERRLDAALASFRPLAEAPDAAEEDLARYLEALALRGLETSRDELIALASRRLDPAALPGASAAFIFRAAYLLTHAWGPPERDIALGGRWLGRCVDAAAGKEQRARALELRARLITRVVATGQQVSRTDALVREALGYLDRAAAMSPGPATSALLATTRARVLFIQVHQRDAQSVLSGVSEGDLEPAELWWYLRAKSELLMESGDQAGGAAVALASYRAAPPEARAFLAHYMQVATVYSVLRLGTKPAAGR